MNGPYTYPAVRPDLPSAAQLQPYLAEIDANGWYTNFGPLVRRLEVQLIERYGHAGETAVSCNNATSGLTAALLATGARGPCLVPAFTFPASLGAVRAAGLDAVIVDVSPDDWTVTPDAIAEAAATTCAGSVMLVAPFGQRRDFAPHLEVCRQLGLQAVIDNAAGLGVMRPAPPEGAIEVFSLHATKTFGVGEGGVILAPAGHDAALRAALNFGLPIDAARPLPAWGLNGKMSEYHAAAGLAQCARIDDIVCDRQAFAAALRDIVSARDDVRGPRDVDAAPWQMYPILLADAARATALIAAGARLSLEIRRYYAPSLSQWPGVGTAGDCPVSEDLSRRICTLPVRRAGTAEAGALLSVIAEIFRGLPA